MVEHSFLRFQQNNVITAGLKTILKGALLRALVSYFAHVATKCAMHFLMELNDRCCLCIIVDVPTQTLIDCMCQVECCDMFPLQC